MWQSIVQILLILIQGGYEWWKKREEQANSALERAKEVQRERAERYRLLVEGKEDELSRMDYLRNRALYELFRERMLKDPKSSH